MAIHVEDEQPEVYTIPDNFIKDGYIANGNIRFRNAVEAALLTGVTALILWSLPIQDWTIRLTTTVTFSTPMLIIGIIGVNGDPLSVFLRNAWHWFQSKRVLLYNGKIATVHTRPVESALNKELPRDKIVYALGNMKKSREPDSHDILVEGRDFVFSDDDEFRREETREKEARKKAEEAALKEAKKAAKKKAAEDKKKAKRLAKEAKLAKKGRRKRAPLGVAEPSAVDENSTLSEPTSVPATTCDSVEAYNGADDAAFEANDYTQPGVKDAATVTEEPAGGTSTVETPDAAKDVGRDEDDGDEILEAEFVDEETDDEAPLEGELVVSDDQEK